MQKQAKEKEALDKSEALAEEGDVDGSILFANTAEGFKTQYDALHASFTQPERTMSVCDVCGVFINSTDNEQRRKVSPLLCSAQPGLPSGSEASALLNPAFFLVVKVEIVSLLLLLLLLRAAVRAPSFRSMI